MPLVISGAGVTAPNRSATNLVHCTDLFATILELAGVSVAAALTNRTIDSQSLAPLLTNGTLASRIILTENFSDTLGDAAGRALLDGRYKLIQFQNGTNELYDLAADYLEATNLLARPLIDSHQTAFNALLARSAELQAQPSLNSWSKIGGQFSVRFTPVQRYTYTLQGRDDVESGSWLNVTSTIAPSSDATVAFFDNTPGTNRFYRVEAVIP